MDSKKIVEVFIETDEEDESFSSSSDEGEEGGGARPVGTQWQEAVEQSHKVHIDDPTSPGGEAISGRPPVALLGLGETLGRFEMSEQAGFDLYDQDDPERVGTIKAGEEDLSSSSDSDSDSDSPSPSPFLPKSERDVGGVAGQVEPPGGFDGGGFKEGDGRGELVKLQTATLLPTPEQTGHQSQNMASKSFGGVPVIDPSKLYCICRQPAQTYGMIQCYDCCDWFHGSCVGITRQKASLVKQFYCPLCIDKDPTLVSIFGNKEEKRETEKETYLEKQPRKTTHFGGSKKGGKKHSRRCGECVACLREIDCRKCRFCRDMPKYGGPGRMRQKCIKRQCLKYSRILYAEDPLHSKKRVWQQDIAAELKAVGGELADVSETASNASIESFTETSSQEALSLSTINADTMQRYGKAEETALDGKTPESSKALEVESENLKRTNPKSKPPPRKKPVKRLGRGRKPKQRGAQRSTAKKAETRLSASDFDLPRTSSGRRTKKPFSDFLLGGYSREETYKPQQCQGPGCVFAARPHSKYCSEECGVQLAMNRIKTFLPEKQKLWAGDEEPIATRNNREKLEQLEGEQKTMALCIQNILSTQQKVSSLSQKELEEANASLIRSHLEELDHRTQAIDVHVTRLVGVSPVREDESSEVESDDLTIHCATCSQPVTLKKAMVHLEKCFSKLEGMVSFGSIVKNEGTNIFCDKYDTVQKTYCKRLRVLCPEHTKEPKIGPSEVCGCPLDPQFPAATPECREFCRQPKRACVRHYCWEKLRRAEIDQEKLNLYLKLEEVSEQSRLHQWQIEHRGSLLAVMLHHTIRHDDKEEGSAATGSSNGSGGVGTLSMDVIDPTMDLS